MAIVVKNQKSWHIFDICQGKKIFEYIMKLLYIITQDLSGLVKKTNSKKYCKWLQISKLANLGLQVPF